MSLAGLFFKRTPEPLDLDEFLSPFIKKPTKQDVLKAYARMGWVERVLPFTYSRDATIRRLAIESLGATPGTVAVARLAACVHDRDAGVACAAIEELARLPAAQADERLMQALRRRPRHGGVRVQLVMKLWRRNDLLSACPWLMTDRSEDVRMALCFHLMRGDLHQLELARQVFDALPKRTKDQATVLSRELSAAAGRRAETFESARTTLAVNTFALDWRLSRFRGLKDRRVVPFLLEYAQTIPHNDREKVFECACLCAEASDLSILFAAADQERDYWALLSKVTLIRPLSLCPQLHAVVKRHVAGDAVSVARLKFCVEALAKLDHREAAPTIVQLLEQPDLAPQVKGAVHAALYAIGDLTAIDFLRLALRETPAGWNYRAMDALARLGERDLIPELERLVEHDLDLRAAKALRTLYLHAGVAPPARLRAVLIERLVDRTLVEITYDEEQPQFRDGPGSPLPNLSFTRTTKTRTLLAANATRCLCELYRGTNDPSVIDALLHFMKIRGLRQVGAQGLRDVTGQTFGLDVEEWLEWRRRSAG